jgi:hypothetical protein
MKKLLLLSLLIIFSCSKEDNSGLLDQISNLQSQNSQLQSEINSLKSQVSQIPSLESQLNQALSNYENSIINIEGLEEEIDIIKLNYRQMSIEVSQAFDKLNNFPFDMGVNVSTFFWGNFVDENGDSRGSYMFEFDNDNLVSTTPFWTSYTDSFNPTLNVYKWNGDCWVYIEDLSLRENGQSYIEGVKVYSDGVFLSTLNGVINAQSLGLTSGYDSLYVSINFAQNQTSDKQYDDEAQYKASIRVYDSNSTSVFETGWTDLNIGEYSDIILELCPD